MKTEGHSLNGVTANVSMYTFGTENVFSYEKQTKMASGKLFQVNCFEVAALVASPEACPPPDSNTNFYTNIPTVQTETKDYRWDTNITGSTRIHNLVHSNLPYSRALTGNPIEDSRFLLKSCNDFCYVQEQDSVEMARETPIIQSGHLSSSTSYEMTYVELDLGHTNYDCEDDEGGLEEMMKELTLDSRDKSPCELESQSGLKHVSNGLYDMTSVNDSKIKAFLKHFESTGNNNEPSLDTVDQSEPQSSVSTDDLDNSKDNLDQTQTSFGLFPDIFGSFLPNTSNKVLAEMVTNLLSDRITKQIEAEEAEMEYNRFVSTDRESPTVSADSSMPSNLDDQLSTVVCRQLSTESSDESCVEIMKTHCLQSLSCNETTCDTSPPMTSVDWDLAKSNKDDLADEFKKSLKISDNCKPKNISRKGSSLPVIPSGDYMTNKNMDVLEVEESKTEMTTVDLDTAFPMECPPTSISLPSRICQHLMVEPSISIRSDPNRISTENRNSPQKPCKRPLEISIPLFMRPVFENVGFPSTIIQNGSDVNPERDIKILKRNQWGPEVRRGPEMQSYSQTKCNSESNYVSDYVTENLADLEMVCNWLGLPPTNDQSLIPSTANGTVSLLSDFQYPYTDSQTHPSFNNPETSNNIPKLRINSQCTQTPTINTSTQLVVIWTSQHQNSMTNLEGFPQPPRRIDSPSVRIESTIDISLITTKKKAKQYVSTLTEGQLCGVNQDGSILHKAVQRENLHLVMALLEDSRLDETIINSINSHQQTPLYQAVKKNLSSIVYSLIKKKANVNLLAESNRTTGARVEAPLHLAVTEQNREIFKELLKAENLDMNILNSEGRTSLHCAVLAHKKDHNIYIIEKLLRGGADPTLRDTAEGMNCLMYAILSSDYNIIQKILTYSSWEQIKKMVTAESNSGMTCLTLAHNLDEESQTFSRNKLLQTLEEYQEREATETLLD